MHEGSESILHMLSRHPRPVNRFQPPVRAQTDGLVARHGPSPRGETMSSRPEAADPVRASSALSVSPRCSLRSCPSSRFICWGGERKGGLPGSVPKEDLGTRLADGLPRAIQRSSGRHALITHDVGRAPWDKPPVSFRAEAASRRPKSRNLAFVAGQAFSSVQGLRGQVSPLGVAPLRLGRNDRSVAARAAASVGMSRFRATARPAVHYSLNTYGPWEREAAESPLRVLRLFAAPLLCVLCCSV
jgi:hypothetical protein